MDAFRWKINGFTQVVIYIALKPFTYSDAFCISFTQVVIYIALKQQDLRPY